MENREVIKFNYYRFKGTSSLKENSLLSLVYEENNFNKTNTYISKYLSCSNRQVSRIVKNLMDKGYIEVSFPKGKNREIKLINKNIIDIF